MARELIYQRVNTRAFTGYEYREYTAVRKWCIAHFGPSIVKSTKERTWHGKLESYYTSDSRNYRAAFYFRNRANATFFALHWS
jgi:hypothetical protein